MYPSHTYVNYPMHICEERHSRPLLYNWWIAGVIPAVALVIAEPTPFIVLRTQITVFICILLFALGFVRLLNGADAVFMIFVLLAFLPLSLGFFIPIGVICLAIAPGCALMMAILKKQIVSHSYFRLLLRQDVPLYQF